MLNLQQQLKLQQKLSPQQLQYIKLLQLNHLALEQRIQSELQVNPMLEEDMTLEPDDVPDTNDDEFDWEELLPSGESDFEGYKAQVSREDRFERVLPAESSQVEQLHTQLSFLPLNTQQKLIAEQIIGSIDDDGYLRRDLLSIVDTLVFSYGESVAEEDVEQVLHSVQSLDPVGIGARDLRECLTVQAEMLPEQTPGRQTALVVLARCYEDFKRKRFSRILDRLHVDKPTLKRALDLIQSLNPKPGRGTFTAHENYITPDFEVKQVEGELYISATAVGGPKLHLSPHYVELLKQLTPENRRVSRGDDATATRQFLKKKLESARWFIDAIEQRRQTVMAVMHAIVTKQEDFFKNGAGHLKPLILMDIAKMIDVDISTVSRAVNGKYVQCDFGIFELKYFFSEGVATRNGEMVSNKEVKSIIAGIIREEDKSAPLSDQKLTDMLSALNFRIARRTVSKYREQLGIPVARLRKDLVVAS